MTKDLRGGEDRAALERAKNDNPFLNGRGRDDDDQGSEGEEDRVADEIDPEANGNGREDKSDEIDAENRSEDESEDMQGTWKSYREIIQVIQMRKIIQL